MLGDGADAVVVCRLQVESAYRTYRPEVDAAAGLQASCLAATAVDEAAALGALEVVAACQARLEHLVVHHLALEDEGKKPG